MLGDWIRQRVKGLTQWSAYQRPEHPKLVEGLEEVDRVILVEMGSGICECCGVLR